MLKREGTSEAELKVSPETVRLCDRVEVTVTGSGDLGSWYVGVCSEGGTVRSTPTTLDACAIRSEAKGGGVTYSLSYNTVGYEYGEHRVTVSPKSALSGAGTRVRKFTVIAQKILVASAGGRRTDGYIPYGRGWPY